MNFSNLIRKCLVFTFALIVFTITASSLRAEDTTPGDKTTDKETDVKQENEGWKTEDYKPYIKTMQDLEKLSKQYSENRLSLAKDEFAKGLDILKDMVADIEEYKTEAGKKSYLEEKWYWQEVDRKNAQQRYITRLKVEAKTKSVTYFTRAIKNLDEIQSNELRSDPRYIELKAALFRVYVSTQYDLGNLKPCIPVLERYIELSEQTRKDKWAYKYLASCYAFMETILDNSRATPEESVAYYRNRKNQSILKAVELEFGRDSVEYKEMQKVVQRDEKASTVINVNK